MELEALIHTHPAGKLNPFIHYLFADTSGT